MREKSVCFTGHREIPCEKITDIKKRLSVLIGELIKKGYTDFYSGGAYGFDQIAAEAVIEVKRHNPNIKLHLILPYHKPSSNAINQEYISIMAESVEYASERYLPGCFQLRNKMLVDASSLCICYLEKSSGGTYYTVNYAKTQGIEIIRL